MVTKKELEENLKEISDLKNDFQLLSDDFEEIKYELKNELTGNKKLHIMRLNEIRLLQGIKNEILGYTIQIVSIIVAIMAVVLTISYLSMSNFTNPINSLWIPYSLFLYICVLFTIWFFLNIWNKKKR